MGYNFTELKNGDVLDASVINNIQNGIKNNDENISSISNILSNISISSSSNVILKPLNSNFYNGKTIACIGDSITAGVGASNATTKCYPYVLCEMLGATLKKLGASGTVLCTGGHRTCNITQLTKSKISGASLVTIMMGINDWDQAKNQEGSYYYSLGELGSTDTTTIYGALDMWCKRVIELKQDEEFKDTKFFFITPIVTSWNNSVGGKNWNQDKTNVHGFKLRDLCYAIINTCATYKIPVLDMNKYSGIYYNSDDDNSTSLYFGDGIHPNDAGHEKIAESLRDYILSNPEYASSVDAIDYILSTLLSEKMKITYPNQVFDNKDIPLQGIMLSETSVSLYAGESKVITHTLVPQNTTQQNVLWESKNTNVAVVNEGNITAVSPGNVEIVCKSADSNISATCSVTVLEPESKDLTNLIISNEYLTLDSGLTTQLSVTYVPSNTDQKNVYWESSDNNVATVSYTGNGEYCTVTAKNIGQCYIKAKSVDNPNVYCECFFTTSESGSGNTGVNLLSTLQFSASSDMSYDSTQYKLTSSNTTSSIITDSDAKQWILSNVPIGKGKEVEFDIVMTGTNGFYVWGLTTSNDITNIADSCVYTNNHNILSGFPNFYYDYGNQVKNGDKFQFFNEVPSTTLPKQYFVEGNGENMANTTLNCKVKRDASGVISLSVNGVTYDYTKVTKIDTELLTTTQNTDNLYLCGDGTCMGTARYITFKYIGDAR